MLQMKGDGLGGREHEREQERENKHSYLIQTKQILSLQSCLILPTPGAGAHTLELNTAVAAPPCSTAPVPQPQHFSVRQESSTRGPHGEPTHLHPTTGTRLIPSSWRHWSHNGQCHWTCVCSMLRWCGEPLLGYLSWLPQGTWPLVHTQCPCYILNLSRCSMLPLPGHGAILLSRAGFPWLLFLDMVQQWLSSLGCCGAGAGREEGGMADTSFSDCSPPPRLRLWNKTLAGLLREMISSMYELSQRTQYLSLWCLF